MQKKKLLFKYETICALCYVLVVHFMRQNSRFMQICALSTRNVISRAEKKVKAKKLFLYPPTKLLMYKLRVYSIYLNHPSSPVSDDLLQFNSIHNYFYFIPTSFYHPSQALRHNDNDWFSWGFSTSFSRIYLMKILLRKRLSILCI